MRQNLSRIAVATLLTVIAGQSAFALDELNWSPRNHELLKQFLHEHGRGSAGHDAKQPPYAVFDWDDTSIFSDCGHALFRHQIWNLAFRLDKDHFRSLFQDEINGVRVLKGPPALKLVDINEDVATAYDFLYDHCRGLGGKQPVDDVRATPQFQEFVAKLLYLYEAYNRTENIGPAYSNVWILYFLADFTLDEVRELARVAIRQQLGEGLRYEVWRSPAGQSSRAGPVDVTFRNGLRVQPEMQNLMASSQAAGIDVYVVSASMKQVVEVCAGPGFGYNLPPDHVIGMELELREGKVRPSYKRGWVQTYREGKVEAIRAVLGARGDPLLAAGDSDGDFEMLSGFTGTKLGLIINRLEGDRIGTLCRTAVAQGTAQTPRYILQGRDENTGLFVPRSETTRLGEAESRLTN
jgi:phosphoserine phosphatase